MRVDIEKPFNISFGETPSNIIPRRAEQETIRHSFESPIPDTRVYIITGPRGSGKTVLLSSIKKEYVDQKNWVVVDLNPYEDMMRQMCAQLYERGKIKALFTQAEFSFSFHGFGLSIKGDTPVSDLKMMVAKMLDYLKKKQKRVLIIIDDVSSTPEMRRFAHDFQTSLRDGHEVFLLMTGVYENIKHLQSEKSLTFLLRAPEVRLEPLSLTAIAIAYASVLGIDREKAAELAKMTMGYAYGFQLLGKLVSENGLAMDQQVLDDYDLSLEENVYSIIWRALSIKDKDILIAVAEGNTTVKAILDKTGMPNSAFQVYKKNLVKEGLIDASTWGEVRLALPRFREFVLLQADLG